MSTHDNPLGLRIGEVVTAKRTCTVDYDGDNRRLWFDDYDHYVIISGSVKRALGKYVNRVGMSPRGHSSLDLGCLRDEGYLKVSKYVRLYECRTTMSAKPMLVHPDDIVI